MKLDIAHATANGHVTHVSDTHVHHPLYGTDAWEMRMKTELTKEEVRVAEELLNIRGGIAMSLRSGIGQIGNEAGEPERSELRLEGNDLVMETLVTNLNGGGEAFVRQMKSMIRNGKQPQIGRMMMLPPEARLSERDVRNAGDSLPFAHEVDKDGTIVVPLYDEHVYGLHDEDMTDALMAEVLSQNSARHAVSKIRQYRTNGEVGHLQSRFHLVALHVTTPLYHVVLNGNVTRDGNSSTFRHGQARFMDAERTRGVRQGELFSTDSMPCDPRGIQLHAEVYHSALSRTE